MNHTKALTDFKSTSCKIQLQKTSNHPVAKFSRKRPQITQLQNSYEFSSLTFGIVLITLRIPIVAMCLSICKGLLTNDFHTE